MQVYTNVVNTTIFYDMSLKILTNKMFNNNILKPEIMFLECSGNDEYGV